MKRKIWLVLALVMVLSALVGCGGKPAPAPSGDATSDQGKAPAPAPANEEAGKTDGVLDVVHASEPDSIDPALNTSVDGAIMLQHAFEGLVKWVDDGNGTAKLAPGMAESWDVSEDGLEWTFHLRDGIKWSDGKPVTAADFKFSYDLLEGEELSRQDALKAEYAQKEAIVGNSERLNTIALDIIEHFEARQAVLSGKGMIVTIYSDRKSVV